MTKNGSKNGSGFTAPYGSFKTLQNLLERMEQGLPSRIDRSYLSNLPGSTQSPLLTGMRSLGLIDSEGHPTKVLKALVDKPAERPSLVDDLVRQHYAAALDLGQNATQAQLEEAFATMGVTGGTRRKAIAFFLAAAKFAEMKVSPHFKTPRPPSSAAKPSKRQRNRGASSNEEDEPPPPPPPPESGLHPFIQGLVKELPGAGAEWPREKREAWTRTALATFDLIYELPPADRKGGDDDG